MTWVSVCERKNASPTWEAVFLAVSRYCCWGFWIFILPFSWAVSNLKTEMDLFWISSLTAGTVYCSSHMENGSNPATRAEVSRTMAFFVVGWVMVFASFL
jgi:hypothetical protein